MIKKLLMSLLVPMYAWAMLSDLLPENISDQAALIWAAQQGKDELVELLLTNGASANSSDGGLALCKAVEGGYVDCVKILIKAGVPLDQRMVDGRTALHAAVHRRQIDIVLMLLKGGASVDARVVNENGAQLYDEGQTALHVAAENGDVLLVQLLLEAGARLDAEDARGKTPLGRACATQMAGEAVRFLIESGSNILDSSGKPVFTAWYLYPDLSLKKIAARDNLWSQLHSFACKGQRVEFMSTLSQIPNRGKEALIVGLHAAVTHGNCGLVDAIREDALPHDSNVLGEALCVAARWGQRAAAQLLIEKGADCEWCDKEYSTPLSAAVSANQADIVAFLIARGALVEREHLLIAIKKHALETLEVLLEMSSGELIKQTSDGDTLLHFAAEYGNRGAVSVLLKRGANLGLRNRRGMTALHYAAQRGIKSLVQMLIDYNADVDLQDSFLKIPLHYAAQQGAVEPVRCLLLAKSALNTHDLKGRTPLHYAFLAGATETIRLLIEFGADLEAFDNDGKTPVDLARNDEDISPLHSAVIRADYEQCKTLSSLPSCFAQAAYSAPSYKRMLTILCCIRYYARLPREILFAIFSQNEAILHDLAVIIFSGLKSNRERDPILVIKNGTAWRVKLRYDQGAGTIEEILVPHADWILSDDLTALTSLEIELYGDVWRLAQRKPLNVLVDLVRNLKEHSDSDVIATLQGGTGIISQFTEQFRTEFAIEPLGYWERMVKTVVPQSRMVLDAFAGVKFARLAKPNKIPPLRTFLCLPKDAPLELVHKAYERLRGVWQKEKFDNPQNKDYADAVLAVLSDVYRALKKERTALSFDDLYAVIPEKSFDVGKLNVLDYVKARLMQKKSLSREEIIQFLKIYALRRHHQVLDRRDRYGRTAEDLAVARGHHEIAALLRNTRNQQFDDAFLRELIAGAFPYVKK